MTMKLQRFTEIKNTRCMQTSCSVTPLKNPELVQWLQGITHEAPAGQGGKP
jgi:hypothetical protein